MMLKECAFVGIGAPSFQEDRPQSAENGYDIVRCGRVFDEQIGGSAASSLTGSSSTGDGRSKTSSWSRKRGITTTGSTTWWLCAYDRVFVDIFRESTNVKKALRIGDPHVALVTALEFLPTSGVGAGVVEVEQSSEQSLWTPERGTKTSPCCTASFAVGFSHGGVSIFSIVHHPKKSEDVYDVMCAMTFCLKPGIVVSHIAYTFGGHTEDHREDEKNSLLWILHNHHDTEKLGANPPLSPPRIPIATTISKGEVGSDGLEQLAVPPPPPPPPPVDLPSGHGELPTAQSNNSKPTNRSDQLNFHQMPGDPQPSADCDRSFVVRVPYVCVKRAIAEAAAGFASTIATQAQGQQAPGTSSSAAFKAEILELPQTQTVASICFFRRMINENFQITDLPFFGDPASGNSLPTSGTGHDQYSYNSDHISSTSSSSSRAGRREQVLRFAQGGRNQILVAGSNPFLAKYDNMYSTKPAVAVSALVESAVDFFFSRFTGAAAAGGTGAAASTGTKKGYDPFAIPVGQRRPAGFVQAYDIQVIDDGGSSTASSNTSADASGGSGTSSSSSSKKISVEEFGLAASNTLEDPGRSALSCALSQDSRYVVVADSLGRVGLYCCETLRCLNLWKGYREAQVAFLPVNANDDGENELVVIYATRRGLLEVWDTRQRVRKSAFNLGTKSETTLLGMSATSSCTTETTPILLMRRKKTQASFTDGVSPEAGFSLCLSFNALVDEKHE
ncbi:unnamed protein product [Amoebophrya sp. A25]|nr:unnamed protein product [Amoebophrya sp. A25]|eukprot:GSA25T00007313001.1